MKRSEMIESIRKRLEGSSGFDELDYYDFSYFLQIVEDLGMQPPHYSPMENGRRGFPIADWEPEEIPPCESCEKNDLPNCGMTHCSTRKD